MLRVTCESCRTRLAECPKNEHGHPQPAKMFEVGIGNPAPPDMGHKMYWTEAGRLALCAAERRAECECRDQWWGVTADNRDAVYGYGTHAEAERWCDALNGGLTSSLYAPCDIDDMAVIDALNGGTRDDGCTISEVLAALDDLADVHEEA